MNLILYLVLCDQLYTGNIKSEEKDERLRSLIMNSILSCLHDEISLSQLMVCLVRWQVNQVINKTSIAMEVSALTTIISNKYEVNIEFKFTELDKHYAGEKLWAEKPFQILDYFHGYVNVWTTMQNGENTHLLVAYVTDVENLSGKVFEIAVEPYFTFKSYDIPPMLQRAKRGNTLRINIDTGKRKLKTVYGKLQLSFQASKGQLMKQTLMHGFSGLNQHFNNSGFVKSEKPEMSRKTEKIKIICENGDTMFDKSLLCSISDVFQAMFENPNNAESQNGAVFLEGIDTDTIKGFERLMK